MICIMNPDVRLKASIFYKTINEFEKNHELGMLGYKQIGGFDLSFYLKPEFYLSFLSPLINKYANKLNYFNQKYFYLSGAFLFIDKTKFEEIGNFDENIFLYFEEPDISRRLLKSNFTIKFDKNYEYLHLIGKRDNWSENTYNNWLFSISYYLKKFDLNQKKYFRWKKIELILKFVFAKISFNKIKVTRSFNEYHSLITFLSSTK